MLSEFDRSGDTVFGQLCTCPIDVDLVQYKTAGQIRFLHSPAKPGKRKALASYVSTQLYMTSRVQLKKLFPLPFWRHHLEWLLQRAMGDKDFRSTWLALPDLCKSTFDRGVAGTPLTPAERSDAAYSMRHFNSNAKYEQFNLTVAHGICKPR